MKALPVLSVVIVWLLFAVPLLAATGGSISGTITDSSGAAISGASISLLNEALQTHYLAISDKQGLYAFPNLPVGHYTVTIEAGGFATQRELHLAVDNDAAIRFDAALGIATQTEAVTVSSEGGGQVDTVTTHLGEIVSATEMTAIPLNGRSYTDLLAIQPGVAPVTTLLPSSVIMAGVTGSIDPSGDANPGNLSINGQRESSNGFLVNGIDVQEHMNGGTSIVPNLDSIEQFRVLTNNFDPEYGNYNGGMITVVSKSGSNRLHGRLFEFVRNTALDARGYFDPSVPAFNQNQFGGVLEGPVRRDKVFFFADYQGTRTTQGIETGNISVPTLAERGGDFSVDAALFSSTAKSPAGQTVTVPTMVSGPYFAASILTPALGYTVTAGEPYYFNAADANPKSATYAAYGHNCASTAECVFPTLRIPQSAWSAPAKGLLPYIPSPNAGVSQFSTSANAETVRDDKGSLRVDANLRLGQFAAYYFADDYTLDNPYPGSVAGASIPGFDALYLGRAQLIALGDTTIFGADTVNEVHLGYLRNANVIGKPHGGLGVSLAAQGFSSGPDGIYVQAPQFEGVENLSFPTFVMGVPITNLTQVSNTLYASDGLSHVIGPHNLKVGGQFHVDQVNNDPNATFNGTFNIDGAETGSPYADFLLGTANNFTQSSGQRFYLRSRYFGVYAQDSWRALHALTVNVGLRWDVVTPWWERYNQLQTYIPGMQSTLFPGAPLGFVVAGDPGVPRTIAPTGYGNIAPRVGLAYAPTFSNGLARKVLGSNGKSSLRASYGLFYTAFPGIGAGIMYAVPPFGYNYLGGRPLLATPFRNAGDGVDQGQRFPFPFPAHSVSATHPDTSVKWADFSPIAADPFFSYRNRVPYLSNYMLSLQRQLSDALLLTVSYVGNQGHRELSLVSVNPGNPALCLALSQAAEVSSNSQTCGPGGEDTTYTTAAGTTVIGTRSGQGGGRLVLPGTENYGENTADTTVANSNYNALEATLRFHRHGSQFLLSYTYAKSIDQGSSLGEQLNPIDPRQSRAISAWDLKHDLVASYTIALPFDRVHRGLSRLTRDWSVSGVTRFATGFPVTLFDNSDNSLLGTLGNGANNYLLDTPQYTAGPLSRNTNGRNGKPAFNTSLFQEESLGQLGNAKRRMFYGPGIENFDMTLQRSLHFTDARSLDLRFEAFNAFNHTQFYGPASVDGQIEDPRFGSIDSSAAPRLIQVAAKFSF